MTSRRVLASASIAAAIGLTSFAIADATAIAAKGHAAATASVSLRKTSLGNILVDSKGRTLYLWVADKHGKSTCFGACASVWPPATVKGKPVAGKGITASKLTTVSRGGGVNELVYNGHPLYLYISDANTPGKTTGQGSASFGAPWYVVNAAGSAIDNS